MNEYYFIFLWLIAMTFVSMMIGTKRMEIVEGEKVIRQKYFFSLLVFAPIFLLACLGDPIGDTPTYLDNFKALPTTMGAIIEFLKESESGKGFAVFGFLIKKLFGNNNTSYRICLSLVHSIPIILIYRKYSTNYLLSVFLFVASANHIAWMMNGLRQFMAVTIIFAATPLLIRKKYFAMIIVILLATTIHLSALLMLPVIFIVQGDIWNKKTLLFIVIALIAMYAFSENEMLLDQMLTGTEYEGMNSMWRALGDDGTNPVRVLVTAVPTFLAFIGRNIIKKNNNKIINVCVNMSIITVGLNLIAMVTSGITIGRLPIYTSLYNFILLPYLVKNIFTKKSSVIISGVMIVGYIIYYLFETI